MLRKIAKQLTPPIIYDALRMMQRTMSGPKTRTERGEKDADWYDQSFEATDHWKSHYTKSRYYFLWSVISDRLMPVDKRDILEVGCGSGQLASLLKDKGLKRYCGFDFSPKRVAQARKVVPEFEFVEVDAFKTTLFDDYPYNTVISTEFLEHVEGDLEVLGKIRIGTYFIGTVPNFPYDSHVRHFLDPAEVEQRYASMFDDFRVHEFYSNEGKSIFFMLSGIKN